MEGNDKRTLKKLATELDGWRKENPSSRALPASIWTGAADVARRVGVGPVAKALRLDHSKLKQLTLSSGIQPPVLAATFIELLPLGAHVLGDCAVEVESPYGARMRIQLQNTTSSGLAGLIREFVA